MIMDYSLQPDDPSWPDQDEINLPSKLNLLPVVNPKDPYMKRLLAFLFKRPEFMLTEDYFTYIHTIDAWVWCPKNFVFDFASVPKVLPLLNPTGVLAYPAVPHDFIYRFGGLLVSYAPDTPYTFRELTRPQGDFIFKEQAQFANGLGILNTLATRSLTLFGGMNFKPRDVFNVDWSKPVH